MLDVPRRTMVYLSAVIVLVGRVARENWERPRQQNRHGNQDLSNEMMH